MICHELKCKRTLVPRQLSIYSNSRLDADYFQKLCRCPGGSDATCYRTPPSHRRLLTSLVLTFPRLVPTTQALDRKTTEHFVVMNPECLAWSVLNGGKQTPTIITVFQAPRTFLTNDLQGGTTNGADAPLSAHVRIIEDLSPKFATYICKAAGPSRGQSIVHPPVNSGG